MHHRRTPRAALLALVLLAPACGSDPSVGSARAEVVADEESEPASTTTSASVASSLPLGETTSTVSSTVVPTTPVPVVDWSNVIPATVVEELDRTAPDGDRTRAWLLRFDDRLTLDVAQGVALEARRYGIVDVNGALDLFADGAWVRGACDDCPDPADHGGAATLMEFMLTGGLFGDHDPDPTSPDGARLVLRTYSGVLGEEPVDQIEYLVGSSRLGPMSMWEQRIVDELPETGPTEYLAAIAFEHPCGRAPAGDCP